MHLIIIITDLREKTHALSVTIYRTLKKDLSFRSLSLFSTDKCCLWELPPNTACVVSTALHDE